MKDLRRTILDASVALVAEQGVRAISFREVARRASVSHQAPYHHFESSRGILKEIAREGFEKLNESMNRAAEAAGPDPQKALHACGVAYVNFARNHLGHFRVMFQGALVDIHDPQDPLNEAESAHCTLVRLATAAHKAGYARGLSIEQITLLCWSTVHGIAILIVEGVLAARSHPGEINEALIAEEVIGALTRLTGKKRKKKK